jgi:hypothetical protein
VVVGQDSHDEDEDENKDEFDKDLVYSWYGEASHTEVANKLIWWAAWRSTLPNEGRKKVK